MFDKIILGDFMKITKIQKMKNGKYKIELDHHEKITTYDEVILKNNLLYKKEIDNEMLNQLIKETTAYDGYDRAVRYIATKMRSEKEMRTYLEKYNIPEYEQDHIIKKLKENGLLNEKNYVRAFIADKVNLSNMGPYQIQKELENHNIESDLISQELAQYEVSIFEENSED